jgi:hypothetical protein
MVCPYTSGVGVGVGVLVGVGVGDAAILVDTDGVTVGVTVLLAWVLESLRMWVSLLVLE